MQIEILQELGEMCVKRAKEIPADIGFTDQTGNLRSSIGYVIFKDGVAIRESYQGQSEGVNTGKALAEKVGAKYKKGLVLVVTAGMNYAVALESGRRKKPDGTYYSVPPRDVLTSAELLAKRELPRMLAELKNNIEKALS